MIDYVHAQLSIWGRWAVRRQADGLGFPSTCPTFREYRSPDWGSCPPAGVCEHVQETDQAVQRLSAQDKALCVEFYQIGGPAAEIAKRLGIQRRWLYQRLDGIHCAMLGHLNDIGAGI